MRPISLVLILKNDKLFLSKGKDQVKDITFYRPLGGGIDFGETSLEAIKREIKEELGATLKNEELLKVIENIFVYNGKNGHEIIFLYKGDILEQDFYIKEKMAILDKEGMYAEWVSISDIKNHKVRVFPEELIEFI